MKPNLSYMEYLEGLPFEMDIIEFPQFPDREFRILETGAIGDGIIDNTEAINSAILIVSQEGGGKVIIPAGIWFTGPVILLSNVNLHVEEGLNTRRCSSPLNTF